MLSTPGSRRDIRPAAGKAKEAYLSSEPAAARDPYRMSVSLRLPPRAGMPGAAPPLGYLTIEKLSVSGPALAVNWASIRSALTRHFMKPRVVESALVFTMYRYDASVVLIG